jgi:hypothetical protein
MTGLQQSLFKPVTQRLYSRLIIEKMFFCKLACPAEADNRGNIFSACPSSLFLATADEIW